MVFQPHSLRLAQEISYHVKANISGDFALLVGNNVPSPKWLDWIENSRSGELKCKQVLEFQQTPAAFRSSLSYPHGRRDEKPQTLLFLSLVISRLFLPYQLLYLDIQATTESIAYLGIHRLHFYNTSSIPTSLEKTNIHTQSPTCWYRFLEVPGTSMGAFSVDANTDFFICVCVCVYYLCLPRYTSQELGDLSANPTCSSSNSCLSLFVDSKTLHSCIVGEPAALEEH